MSLVLVFKWQGAYCIYTLHKKTQKKAILIFSRFFWIRCSEPSTKHNYIISSRLFTIVDAFILDSKSRLIKKKGIVAFILLWP